MTQVSADIRSAKDDFYAILRDRWVLGALAGALILRLIRLGDAPLWFDETFTALWVRQPFVDMLRAILADNHLPLYFVLVKGWIGVFGDTPAMLRAPSVLFSALGVGLFAALGQTMRGAVTMRWVAWLAALSPYLLQHGQEARMYSLQYALAAASLLILARFISGRSSRLGWLFVLVNGALVLTHYYSVFLIGGECLALLLLRPQPYRNWLPVAVVSGALVIVPVLLAAFFAHHHAGGSYSLGLGKVPGLFWVLISGYTLTPTSMDLHASGLSAILPYLPIAIPGLIAGMLAFIWGVLALPRDMRILLLATLFAVFLGPITVSLLFAVSIHPRYAAAGAAFFLLALASACQSEGNQKLRLGVVAFLAVVMTTATVLRLANPGGDREDISAVGQWLKANIQEHEEILVTSEEMALFARFHWPERKFRLYPEKKVMATAENAASMADSIPFPEASQRVIYMFGRDWLSDPDNLLKKQIEQKYALCPGVVERGVRIICIQRPS